MRDLYVRRMSLKEPLPRDSYLCSLPAVRYLADNGVVDEYLYEKLLDFLHLFLNHP